MPEHIKPEQVDIWFQDESRIGQQGSLTRVWHKKGKGFALSANHDAKVWRGGLWRERKFCRWRRMRKRLAAVSCFASSSAAAGRLCSRLGAGRLMWRLRTEQTSFARLLRQLRMEAALFLLMSSQTLIGDVAAACGYQSGGHFAAAFKQQFGFLPSDVRT